MESSFNRNFLSKYDKGLTQFIDTGRTKTFRSVGESVGGGDAAEVGTQVFTKLFTAFAFIGMTTSCVNTSI